MKKILCLFLILVPICRIGYAQNAGQPMFSTDPSQFISQVEDMFKLLKRDDTKQLTDEFASAFSKFPGDAQQQFISLCSEMKQRHLATYPYFFNLFQAAIEGENNPTANSQIAVWVQSVQNVFDNQKSGTNKDFTNFIEFSHTLFSKNALYSNAAKTWRTTATDYTLKYDKEPMVIVNNTDLVASTNGDSLFIHQTGGVYYPLEYTWAGTKGRVDWTRAGLDAGFAYCTFGKYSIQCQQSEYNVDTTTMFYKPLSDKKLIGSFSDKLLTNNTPATTSYPRFDSYDMTISMNNLDKAVRLSGGISIHGAHLSVSGNDEHPAILNLLKPDGGIALTGKAKDFEIKKFENILTDRAQVSLYMGKDSIFHYGCELDYKISTHQLVLRRGNSGIIKSPFYDSYHKIEIYADAIFWKTDQTYIDITMEAGKGLRPASLESYNFFEENKFNKYQNITTYNPISLLKQYCDETKSREIDAQEFAKRLGTHQSVETIERLLFELVEEGFIFYDPDKQLITVRDKSINYTLANGGRIDYDIIHLLSQSDSVNMRVDLHNYNMNIRGVKSVDLSDSNFVAFFPYNHSFDLGKNRDMDYGGKMFAGQLDLYGKSFHFHYDRFSVGLDKVDSMIVNIPTGKLDAEHQPILVPLRSPIEGIEGTIIIDDGGNKSGLKKNPQYPILDATKGGFVYYDKKTTLNGIYKRDKFYFGLDPFKKDSLNNMQAFNLRYSGTLTSADIFPDFHDQLRIQKDLSLGLTVRKPSTPVYGGKGTFTDTLTLNNNGLRGKGSINFLTSTSYSHDIIFYPDSLSAPVETFTMASGLVGTQEFPSVISKNDFIHWKPYADSMMIKENTTPFKLFNSETYLSGSLILRSTGLRGSGKVDWSDAQLISKDIRFKKEIMDADTSDFRIKSIDSTKFATITNNVNSHIDFTLREGYFKGNSATINTEFPYNLYRTSIDQFKWEIDKKLLTFKSVQGLATFTSEAPEQDSLKFEGNSAFYDLNKYVLTVSGIPYIAVADAHIFPDSGKVVIEASAQMRTLINAKIIADTIHSYHNLYNASIRVLSSYNYRGSADLDFLCADKTKEKIHFDDIGVKRDSLTKIYHTYGNGFIADSEKFTILPKVNFKGNVRLSGSKQNLHFDGFAKLQVNNPKVAASWFSVADDFNQDSSLIHFSNPVDEKQRPIGVGILLDADSMSLYPAIFSIKRNLSEHELFSATGIVKYDDSTKTFSIGDENKILNGAERGNVLTYNLATGKVITDGIVTFGDNFGLVTVASSGKAVTTVTTDSTFKFKFTLAIGIKFGIDPKLLEKMAESIDQLNYDKPDLDESTDDFKHDMVELVDPKNEVHFLNALQTDGSVKKSQDFDYTILLSNIQMAYDPLTRSLHSVGPLGTVFVGDKPLGKKLKGYLEIGFKRSGSFINLYIESTQTDWYYLNYQNNIMSIISSDDDFNKQLGLMDPKDRRTQGDNGQIYMYTLSTVHRKDEFLLKMSQYDATEVIPAKKSPVKKNN
jgi:hypothetical protein